MIGQHLLPLIHETLEARRCSSTGPVISAAGSQRERERHRKRGLLRRKSTKEKPNPQRQLRKRVKKAKDFGCKVERRRVESKVKSARCERQEADDRERVKRLSEGEGSEEQLFTDKRTDTWPQSAGRW